MKSKNLWSPYDIDPSTVQYPPGRITRLKDVKPGLVYLSFHPTCYPSLWHTPEVVLEVLDKEWYVKAFYSRDLKMVLHDNASFADRGVIPYRDDHISINGMIRIGQLTRDELLPINHLIKKGKFDHYDKSPMVLAARRYHVKPYTEPVNRIYEEWKSKNT